MLSRGVVRVVLRTTVAVLLLSCAVAIWGERARAGAVYDVQVGRFFTKDHTAESMRFYPGALSVYRGDVLHFTSRGFHDVALLPASTTAADWAPRNAGGRNHTYSVFSPDYDDGDNAVKANPLVFAPSDRCGWPTQESCVFDGTGDDVFGVLNSGLPLYATGSGDGVVRPLDFSVEIQAEPGAVVWVVDLLHPALRMAVTVVDIDDEATSPVAAAQEGNRLFAADKKTAAKLDATYSKKRVHSGDTWTVWAGVDTPTVSLRRMYPAKLTIRRGQTVRWTFAKDRFEAHTVTFPRARGASMAKDFPALVCDEDGDLGTGRDAPAASQPPFCSSPDQLELDVPDALPNASGDGRVTNARDFEHSGVRGAAIATTKDPYTLSFPASGAGFGYVSVIEEIAGAPMRGSIVVKGR